MKIKKLAFASFFILELLAALQAAFYLTFSGPQNTTVLVTPAELTWSEGAYNATAALTVAGNYQVSAR